MTNFLSKLKPYGAIIARLGMGLVFLSFSYYQFSDPSIWTSYVPQSIVAIVGGNAVLLVLLNAWFELVAGLMLIAGLQVRTVSLLLALHLFGISATIGWSPLGVRDIGLAIATLAIFFTGPDIWAIDRKFLKQASPETSFVNTPNSIPPRPIRRI